MSTSKRANRPPAPWPVDKAGRPVRRVRVQGADNRGVYWRSDGRLEIGYTDSLGKLRWAGPFETITAARGRRDEIAGDKSRGAIVRPSPKLTFGAAYERWLAEQVVDLRPRTRDGYRGYAENHLLPRWRGRRLDAIERADVAAMVRELRAQGYAEWTIASAVRVAGYVFRFAGDECGWRGVSPVAALKRGQRPRISETLDRRVYTRDDLEQVLAASSQPWRTLFRLAGVVGGRESELLGLWWDDLALDDLDAATIRFGFQVDRQGGRVELKTEESKAVLPLPRSTAAMLLEHKARTPAPTGPRTFVFATASGRPLGQRNVLRALYRAQERARRADGTPTFPELFEVDARGELRVDDDGVDVPRDVKRRELNLPHFHSIRHTAAMDCDDAEEARDLLRHKNSNVTRAIYRAHFSDQRRELLRARLEARHGRPDAATEAAAPSNTPGAGEVVPMRRAS